MQWCPQLFIMAVDIGSTPYQYLCRNNIVNHATLQNRKRINTDRLPVKIIIGSCELVIPKRLGEIYSAMILQVYQLPDVIR